MDNLDLTQYYGAVRLTFRSSTDHSFIAFITDTLTFFGSSYAAACEASLETMQSLCQTVTVCRYIYINLQIIPNWSYCKAHQEEGSREIAVRVSLLA